MSVKDKIEEIKTDIANAYEAVADKGGSIPSVSGSANLAQAIASIPENQASTFLVKAPVGTIVIWSGTETNIPKGWQLCNGLNNTPDLRDKFVLGAGGNYNAKTIGGAARVTLTEEQMPRHRHVNEHAAVSFNNQYVTYTTSSGSGKSIYAYKGTSSSGYYTEYTGSGESHENMPPYYALCYIMKVTPDDTHVSAEDVIFEPGETGLEATNIQQAIEELSERGGESSGGTVTPDLSDVSSMKYRQVTLLSTLWGEDNKQTVICSDVIENDKGQLIVTIPDTDSADVYFSSFIKPVEQLNDSITFYAENIPEEDVVVDVYILGAAEIKEEITGEFEWWSPKMDSDNTPEPYIASASDYYGTYRPYRAFDGYDSTYYNNSSNLEVYLQFDFGKKTQIRGIRILPHRTYLTEFPKEFIFEGSNDGNKWLTIYEEDGTTYPNTPTAGSWQTYNLPLSNYRKYKLTVIGNYKTQQNKTTYITEMEFYKLKEETT